MSDSIVIIPTYNEKENIESIISAVFSLPQSFDILVIDDGSPDGTAAVTTPDGRVTLMMPHPERAIRPLQLSYSPPTEGCPKGGVVHAASPWLRLFQNARAM